MSAGNDHAQDPDETYSLNMARPNKVTCRARIDGFNTYEPDTTAIDREEDGAMGFLRRLRSQ
jgi:hypothetical protein